jgi:hypothetical protein
VEQPAFNRTNIPTTLPVSTGSTIVGSTDSASAQIPESTAPRLGQSLGFARRQDARTGPVPSPMTLPSGTVSSSTIAMAVPTLITFPTTNGPPLVQIGKYNCTSLMTLELLTGLLEDFLEVTATTTGAAVLMLMLDVHAAASLLNPNAPAPQLSQNQLPVSGSLLSDVMQGNLSSVTYTPALLRKHRANLNDSWLNVDWNNRPALGYYDTATNSGGDRFTTSGWPTEGYIEFQKYFRLVTGYGTIDPQMQLYNIGPDLDFVFPPGTLADLHVTSSDSDGRLLSGCLFDPANMIINPNKNSSWAVTAAPPPGLNGTPDPVAPIPAISNFTSCGLTAIVNETIANTTADKNPIPYAAYVRSTLWSWAPGEPQNVTSPNNRTSSRCVVMSTLPYPGRWRATDCLDRRRVACHNPYQPYNWTISSDVTNYDGAPSVCRSGYYFSVPHTALENAHLLAVLQNDRNNAGEAIFVDLNSLSVPDCWVIGRNGSCPYLSTDDTDRIRIVVVPTIAAVIIFVLAALTFFVKCASNRRENKRGRKRRMVDGWEYEGVPS